jgi:hypothetical protein
MSRSSFIDKRIDFLERLLAPQNRVILTLCLLFLLAFGLRVLSAQREPVSADEMVHGVHPWGFIASGKLQIMDQSAVWFFLSDLFMQLWGTTLLGARLTSVLFGSASILVLYLLGSLLWNKRAGLGAALAGAVSSFQLVHMEASMDTAMVFFVLLSLYCMVRFLSLEKRRDFYLAFLFAGIAVMIKPIALLFIPALGFSYLFYFWKQGPKKTFLRACVGGIIVVGSVLPVLIFNYLLYQDKGILDLQFARFTRIGIETYASIAPTIESFHFSELFISYREGMPGIVQGISGGLYHFDSLLFCFLALGGLYLFLTKGKYRLMLMLSCGLPFLFLGGVSLLSNHLVFTSAYASLFVGIALAECSTFSWIRKHEKVFWIGAGGLLLVGSMLVLSDLPIRGLLGPQNEMSQLVLAKERYIPSDALVVVDARIYRGRMVFAFLDRHYLEGSYFEEIVKGTQQYPQAVLETPVYYIECVQTDCGWGTIHSQPAFNASMQELTSFFAQHGRVITTIRDRTGAPYFRLYETTLPLHRDARTLADSTHEWFFYPVGYEPQERVFDNYRISSGFQAFLHYLGLSVLYLDVLIALSALLFIIWCTQEELI